VSWSIFRGQGTHASVPVAILDLVTSSLICGLSHLEHSRSVRPSSLLSGYLLLSPLLDCAQLRTLFILGKISPMAILFAASWGLKLVMLVVESQEKTSCLKTEYQSLPPELTSGIINRSLLWWLNGLFKTGHRGKITESDLFELDPALTAEHLGSNLQDAWDRRSMLCQTLSTILV
jgi:ATP-binding cassette subfamily C (CFTR/MRP) protein 1